MKIDITRHETDVSDVFYCILPLVGMKKKDEKLNLQYRQGNIRTTFSIYFRFTQPIKQTIYSFIV